MRAAFPLLAGLLCVSALRLPNVMDSNMVLARAPLPPRVWGWANGTVTVVLDGNISVTAEPGADGSWEADLPMQQASTGHTISISDTTGAVSLTDIAFGDLYLCSGQSNMEFSTNDAFNSSEEIADSANYADLRLYTIKDTAADTPQLDGVSKANYTWSAAGPSAFVPPNGAAFSYFSATCYFFGRDLYRSLGGRVPIGLVASDWGGQKVECFSSPEAMADATCGGTQALLVGAHNDVASEPGLRYSAIERLSLPAQASDEPNPGTSQLWYGQIYPFLPMRFTGAVWYQGEANAGDPNGYACRFPAMISDWRRKFDLPDLSFFYVELAAFSSDYSLIRAAQKAALKLPKTGFATAIDLGDPTSPQGSIHPRRKQEVGRRLALSCLKVQYGQASIVSEGPTVDKVEFGETDGSATIHFRPDTAQGLHFNGSAACSACCDQAPLELSVDGQSWQRAATFVVGADGTSVVAKLNITSPIAAVGVRFDWEGYPQCALYNGARTSGPDSHNGIAATPFSVSPPPPPPSSWRPIFRQTLPTVFKAGEWSLNPADTDAESFSVLDQLESMRSASTKGFDFKLRWPDVDGTETLVWQQADSPLNKTTAKVVNGFKLISGAHASGFGGLALNSQANECLLDGQPGSTTWFFCIGYYGVDWGRGLAIPGYVSPVRPAKAVELFAQRPTDKKWQIIFRQTLPHLWPRSTTRSEGGVLRLNPSDPNNETFAILDDIESFRDPSSGLLTLKMNWPDKWNTWYQSSNPVTASTDGVEDYRAIDVQFTEASFGGLERNTKFANSALLDGSVGANLWYYAVGYMGNASGWANIPAWGPGAQQVELFLRQ